MRFEIWQGFKITRNLARYRTRGGGNRRSGAVFQPGFGGWFSVDGRRRHFGTGANDHGQITVAIEGSGIGIPAKDRDHIFLRYYRGSNASGYVGTGIGLCPVSTVIRLHAGDIAVESKEGKGARFTTTLPGQYGTIPSRA
jgi:signal transduction histidine kinase